jgi:hypothetical protein
VAGRVSQRGMTEDRGPGADQPPYEAVYKRSSARSRHQPQHDYYGCSERGIQYSIGFTKAHIPREVTSGAPTSRGC